MPTYKQIEDMIDRAIATDGKLHGMTYEQGVRAALEWVQEWYDEGPIDPTD